METNPLPSILESLLFVSEGPLALSEFVEVLGNEGVTAAQVQEALDSLKTRYETEGRGWVLREVAGGYQFISNPTYSSWIQKLNAPKAKSLSQPALETLAIMAYRQPVVRSEIEEIRGVDTGGVLKTLLERGLIRIIGRKDEPGQPLIYGTTQAFLELFDLKSLEELPSLQKITEELQGNGSDNGLDEDDEDEEEKTDLMDDDEDEEDTDLLPPGDWPEDEEALGELDQSLKKMKQLEKEIFPKEVTTTEPNKDLLETAETPDSEDAGTT